ncbi:MAG TPA: PAS domain-containing protein [Dongiaceae bacterium]|jgi:hypothetical protein|nr:PAS domain-containing protein [Dongiaceae bacterium]
MWSPSLLAESHRSLQNLYTYWNAQRGTRSMPGRGDIDPVDLKSLLPDLILIDVVTDPRRYVYRLVGTHEVDMRGRDPTGKAVDEAYYGESAEDTTDYLDRVVRTCAPVLYRGTYQPLRTRTQRDDVLFLPLSKDGDAVNMIMVLSHTDWMKEEPPL